jgi:hypothetical protein
MKTTSLAISGGIGNLVSPKTSEHNKTEPPMYEVRTLSETPLHEWRLRCIFASLSRASHFAERLQARGHRAKVFRGQGQISLKHQSATRAA